QRILRQAGDEEAGRACSRVSLGPLQRFGNSLGCVLTVFKKYVRARVDEQVDALLLCRFADRTEAPGLSVDSIKARAFDDPILEVDADHAQVDKTRNVVSKLDVVFAITALEIHGDRGIDARRDTPNDLLGEFDRDRFTVLVALRRRDRPTACRDR